MILRMDIRCNMLQLLTIIVLYRVFAAMPSVLNSRRILVWATLASQRAHV